MLHADSAQNRLAGIGLVSLAFLLFTLLDGSAKWLVGSMPVIMVVWLRFVMHALIGGAVLFPLRGLALSHVMLGTITPVDLPLASHEFPAQRKLLAEALALLINEKAAPPA